tara:strand:- start:455 stop:1576 length:1122 start_codon:yes stop_codon:yes gene_type:complete
MKHLLIVFLSGLFLSLSLNAQQDPEKSLQTGNLPVQITVSNAYPTTVSILWMDFNGAPQNYGTLLPGSAVQLDSYPGHLWRFGGSGVSAGRYRSTSAKKQSYTISENHPGVNQTSAPSRTTVPVPVPVSAPNPANGVTGNQVTNSGGQGDLGKQLWGMLEKKTGVRVTQNPSGPPAGNQPGTPRGNANANPRGNIGQQVMNVPVVPAAPVAPANAVAPGIATTGSNLKPGEAQALVDYHNRVRAEVGVGGVTWSPQIAAFSQQWADELARRGTFEHRPQSQQKYGENLAGGSTGTFTVVSGAEMWYGEKKLYRAGATFTAAMLPAGHYTQMVWRSSNQIGAGMAICQKGQYRGWTILVCNYSDRGNMVGSKPY